MMTAREHTHHLALLLRNEQGAMADFLLALSAFDREKRWRELGHTSLFYCYGTTLQVPQTLLRSTGPGGARIGSSTVDHSAMRGSERCSAAWS